MLSSSNTLSRIILPLAIIYFVYTISGPTGGVIALIVLLLAYIYFNRSVFYQNKAGKKYHNGDYEGALADMKTAVSIDPKNAKVRGTYAFLLIKMGYTGEAAEQIEEALTKVKTIDDKNSMIITKALVLWKQGNIDQAIVLLDELLKTFETTNVYSTLGLLYNEKGNSAKALEFNLLAKDYNSSNPAILDNLGTSYFNSGDYDNAFETYKEVMKFKPTFPEAYYNYAKMLERNGDLEKALYMLRTSQRLNFWFTSTVTKEMIETYINELEAKEKEIENQRKASIETGEPEDSEELNDTTEKSND